jgi:hypothetical protein
MGNEKNETQNGPRQKAPGYDDTIERDTVHDPAIDDPDPGSAPIADPDTEGQMGQPDGTDENEVQESDYSIGG